MSTLLKTVAADSYLTLHYRLGLPDGSDIVNTFPVQPATLLLGQQQLLPALENALLGLAEGDTQRVTLSAEQAFGAHNSELVQALSLATVAAYTSEETPFSIGDWVEFNAPGGGRMIGQLKSQNATEALFDFNHPLAGLSIVFEAQIIAIL